MRLVEILMGGGSSPEKLSDHCPIVLKDVELDFIPKPFRVFNTWLEEHDFLGIMEGAWKKNVRSIRPDCIFRDRLKNRYLDGYKENGGWLKRKGKYGNNASSKGKIKWDLEECEDRSSKVGRISVDDAQRLEMVFSKNKVWEAIHRCGEDKALGPNGFNFKFIRKTWEIKKLDLLGAIAWFWENMEISKGCNASFVTIIPKVTDLIGLVEKDTFKGLWWGYTMSMVSHLQYADDTIFFGECKIYGIGINEEELAEMARWMGCGIGEFPFTYLGLPIGENMRRIKSWAPVVEKFKKRLADWKAKTMSFVDKWRWTLGEDGKYTVKDLSRLVEEKILHVDSVCWEIDCKRLNTSSITVKSGSNS
ncbi:hypothetical protein Tco_0428528 [Tanacetum coccineum]